MSLIRSLKRKDLKTTQFGAKLNRRFTLTHIYNLIQLLLSYLWRTWEFSLCSSHSCSSIGIRLTVWKIFLHLLLLMAAFIWEGCVACRFGNFFDCHIHLKFELWWWKKFFWGWTFQVNSEHYKQLVKVRNPDHGLKEFQGLVQLLWNGELYNFDLLMARSFNNRCTILIKRCPQGTHFTFLGSLKDTWHHSDIISWD